MKTQNWIRKPRLFGLALLVLTGSLSAAPALAVEVMTTTSIWGSMKDSSGQNMRNISGSVCTTATYSDGEASIECTDVTTDTYGQFRLTSHFKHNGLNSPFGTNDIHVTSYETVFKSPLGEITGQVDSWEPVVTYKAWHLLATNTRAYKQSANFKFNLPYREKCVTQETAETCTLSALQNVIATGSNPAAKRQTVAEADGNSKNAPGSSPSPAAAQPAQGSQQAAN